MKLLQKSFLITYILIGLQGISQQSNLSVFNSLIKKEWKAEGVWKDGSKFKQETVFSFDLNKNIVIAQSKGYTNKEQTEYGLRNHGIRKYDPITKTVHFWEFDVFGRLTEGVVKTEGKNILYQYKYEKSIITDMWEYIDENTYNFKIGNYTEGIWKQVYLETKFTATNK